MLTVSEHEPVGTYEELQWVAHSCLGPAGTRKNKSLRIMSQKFVMLFLVSKTRVITLDLAAKILIEECQDVASHSKYKSTCLQTVGLFVGDVAGVKC